MAVVCRVGNDARYAWAVAQTNWPWYKIDFAYEVSLVDGARSVLIERKGGFDHPADAQRAAEKRIELENDI